MIGRCRLILLACVAAVLASGPRAQDGPEAEFELLRQDAERKLLRGELAAAQAAFEELLDALAEAEAESAPAALPFRAAGEIGLLRIELCRGNYEATRERLAALPAAVAGTRDAVLLGAEAERRLGGYGAAIARLELLVAADPGDCEARHQLGEALWQDGQRARARAVWRENGDRPEPDDAAGLAWQGKSLFRLGGRADLEAASARLVRSIEKAPERPEARTALGLVKFAAYGEARGFPSGERDLAKVLEQNGDDESALLAMYRVRSSNMVLDAAKTERFLDRVLERNPRCVEALVLRAANVLDDRRYRDAAEQLDAALAIDPNDRAALSHRAAVSWLLRDGHYERFRARALAGDSGWPDPDRIIGDHLVALYRFADALPFYAAALAAADGDVPTLSGMAKALIYTGEGDKAKELLLRARALQPGIVEPWRNNAIAVQELIETEYAVVEHPRFAIYMHRDDIDVLQHYLLPVHLEAAEVLGSKYGWLPERSTRVEVLHTWDDFSVRTIGFRGFTALGACFGRLVTLVSPGDADLRRQDFMWEATAWHEYTHVLTLGLSRHRVPRWLTEGFSVYEEKVRDPAWERGMDRELFDAFHNRDIPPIQLMNRLFRGPRILFGYYQGGLIVELIARKYGFEKALDLLRAFGDDLDTEAAFRRVFRFSSQQLDQELLEFIERDKLRGMRLVPRIDDRMFEQLLARARAEPGNRQLRIDLAWAALQRDNPVDAGRWLAEVLRAEPENGRALLVRAELLRRRGELAAAVDCWRRAFGAGADDFDARIHCGDALLELGNGDDAIGMWQQAKVCWPGCTELQTAPELRLAELMRERGDLAAAQMEIKSFCRRTARAFAPRRELAAFERAAGNVAEELRLLRECNRIDPFDRELHENMAAACLKLGKPAAAALEYEVAAAVVPRLDRRHRKRPDAAPSADDPEERAARGQLWLSAARLRHDLGDRERAAALLARIIATAPGSEVAATAARLQVEWR